MSSFIRTFEIPANVRQQYAKFLSLELYDDKLVGKGSKAGDVTWFFKSYITVTSTPANLGTQFAQIIFVTPENANQIISASNLKTAVDVNRIMFCSGMFSYAKANEYVKGLLQEILKVFNDYKSNESSANITASNTNTISSADELKKFKELLDAGVITQDEFDAKKKQLLGL